MTIIIFLKNMPQLAAIFIFFGLSVLVAISVKLPFNVILNILGLNLCYPFIAAVSAVLLLTLVRCSKGKKPERKEIISAFLSSFIFASSILGIIYFCDISNP